MTREPESSSPQSKSIACPFDTFQPDWTISRQMVRVNDLIVQHDIAPPSEIVNTTPRNYRQQI